MLSLLYSDSTMRPRALIRLLALLVVGCSAPLPPVQPAPIMAELGQPELASPSASATAPAAPAPCVEIVNGTLECKVAKSGATCTVDEISEAIAQELAAMPNREALKLVLDEPTQRGVDSLRKVPWLTQLSIGNGKRVVSLESLGSLQNLRKLHVGSLPKAQLTGLSVLTELEDLELQWTEGDLEFLRPLAKLKRLRISNLKGLPRDAALTALLKLEDLQLFDCEVEDLSAIGQLSGLKRLSLYHSDVKDLAPLASLKRLDYLNLSMTNVSSISALASLDSLSSLDLSFVDNVSDLRPLSRLSTLEVLELTQTPRIEDIGSLAGLTSLRSLTLDSTRIKSLKPLARLTSLETLSVQDTAVTDLSPLSGLSSLQSLDVRGTKISSIAPLAGLEKLMFIYLSKTAVRDLKPLEKLSELMILNLPVAASRSAVPNIQRINPTAEFTFED
jgi:Leucine-rich repeat (LRR) protein